MLSRAAIISEIIYNYASSLNIGCCIYSKPKMFGDSSSESESDDEGCQHNSYCTGHKKKGHRSHHHNLGNKGEGPSGLNPDPSAS